MSKSSKSQVQYLLSFRREGKGNWVPTVPLYDRKAVKMLENHYVVSYGEENVRVDVMEKYKRPERKPRDENEDEGY